MVKPAIIICAAGYHNEDYEATRERLLEAKQYMDLSTIILTPTRGMIPAKVVQSWMFLMGPANNKLGRLFCEGMEVASAYNSGITTILGDPIIGDSKYYLTVEDDNIPPHDGLIKLYESICDCDVPCKEHYSIVGGLYFMKGEGGQPMLFGDPAKGPSHFAPQVPEKNAVQECNGTGMGFTLWHSGLFKLPELPRPWFDTVQKTDDSSRNVVRSYTQDLYYMEKLRKLGYRIAVDTSVKVGHFDWDTGQVW